MMDGNDVSTDYVIAELIDMGFEFDKVIEAIETVGPCLDDAVDFILNGSCGNNSDLNERASSSFTCSTSELHPSTQGVLPFRAPRKMKQSNIGDHLSSYSRPKSSRLGKSSEASSSGAIGSKTKSPAESKLDNILKPKQELVHPSESEATLQQTENSQPQNGSQFCTSENQELELDREQTVDSVLRKHFGFSSLKGFQKEALGAWLSNKDCLVLAATGSGKSLCFQIPALLTGKIVVVISPLISLMHDQCLKLAKHGVSACFLGSGQPDSTVEYKAMNGMYRLVYVCPETILRLIEPLKRLAENHGIALFAIDEVHCVSKWGHDFRPDYRRLSVLRDTFRASKLNFLKFDIPLMALTATATIPVREDIIKSLHMSKETKTVLTSFFRPNLRFSVKHSRTSSTSSYDTDFCELIKTYTTTRVVNRKVANPISNDIEDDSDNSYDSSDDSLSNEDETSLTDTEGLEDDNIDGSTSNDADVNSPVVNSSASFKGRKLTLEYLEDELDVNLDGDDFDVSCGEFPGTCLEENTDLYRVPETSNVSESLGQGPTIIYVPTRKETVKLASFFCKSGIKAAAYHAKLPKPHLRRVHEDFHHNSVEVVVATIAFGMGIDKSNVRRVIHYGWPQSLEAYYQEAGRAGRDGKLSDCILYANLSRIPSLLPSQRSEEQTKQAYKMLGDCFRYGMSKATCRAKTLVKYFGEEFDNEKCNLCDICVAGPPEMQNLKEEAVVFMRVLKALYVSHRGALFSESSSMMLREKPNFKMIVSRIRDQFQKFSATDRLWWQGLARILSDKGYIKEGDDMTRVSIKYPQLTGSGSRFLEDGSVETLCAYPEADMLLALQKDKPYSSFSEWGRGWADPEIRRQRLQRKGFGRFRLGKRKRRSRKQDVNTVRGRLAAKLTKQKR